MIALLIFSKNCSSLDISYRNVSVVPFKFQGYIVNLNKIIQMLIAVPASIFVGYQVELPFLGRKRVLVIFIGEYLKF